MYTQICASNYDMRRNRQVGIIVSMCIKIVPKNVLSESKKPPGTDKTTTTTYDLRQNLLVGINVSRYNRNRPQKRTQRVKKTPGTVKTELQTMICDEIVSWASMCRGTPKQSSKSCSACRKTPRYTQIREEVIFWE